MVEEYHFVHGEMMPWTATGRTKSLPNGNFAKQPRMPPACSFFLSRTVWYFPILSNLCRALAVFYRIEAHNDWSNLSKEVWHNVYTRWHITSFCSWNWEAIGEVCRFPLVILTQGWTWWTQKGPCTEPWRAMIPWYPMVMDAVHPNSKTW